MYNRYLRNDRGEYICVPREESRSAVPPPANSGRDDAPEPNAPPRNVSGEAPFTREARESSGTRGEAKRGEAEGEGFALLGRILDRLHLQDLDSADLMLLALLFFLFEEKADDELLIALGLLLIL